jgi:hypothetical protein
MPTHSLPAPADPPGSFLFSDEVIKEITDQEQKHGIYTAERCPPQLKQAIVKLAGDGWDLREIARTLCTAFETVRNVIDQSAVEIRDYAERLPRRIKRCIWTGLKRMERNMDSVPMPVLSRTLKELQEIDLLATGQATARTEHVHRIELFAQDGPGSFKAFVEELEQRRDSIRALNEPSGIGLLAEKNARVVESAAAPAADRDEPADAPAPSESDWKSEDLSPIPQVIEQDLPTFIPDPDRDRASDLAKEDPPGGEVPSAGARGSAMDQPSQKFLDNEL